MRKLILFFILTMALISCDQLNRAYLENNSDYPISVSLYFYKYNSENSGSEQNTFIQYLMEDSLIKDNIQIIVLQNEIARIDFQLLDNSCLELIYDTAPLHEGAVQFDAFKIRSKKNKIELYGKLKILESFKAKTSKTERYMTINE